MSKTLVIVESPAKAKTIGRYLGRGYRIEASVGHVRDLPSRTLGVDVKRDYTPRYVTMPGKERVVRQLKDAAADADRILLATDPDREGEAIAYHLAHVLKLDPKDNVRVTFNEITSRAVKEGVERPRPINAHLVDAQQSRRVLDRLVGYELSPLLWKKVKKGLSAGRVQSVTTRLIVQREREIEAFEPKEYWTLDITFKTSSEETFVARYYGVTDGAKTKRDVPATKVAMDEIVNDLKDATYVVTKVNTRTAKRQPWAPYTTSTLQQDASRFLGFSSSRTMRIAQQLYEGVTLPRLGQTALITYMRTDSVRVSPEALSDVRACIAATYGVDHLSPSPRVFRSKTSAQDAHEAIRPTHFDIPPDVVDATLTKEQSRLYRLIWMRFLASQMAPAQYERIDVDVVAKGRVFRAKGERLLDPGFLTVWTYGGTNQDQPLPAVAVDDRLTACALTPEQKFTQPPARYTEASLIKTMEEHGIGRPSTYAPTIKTLEDRNYVERLPGRTLKPTELGRLVTSILEAHFPSIVDTDFTADMEHRIDTVETGENDWVTIVDEFYRPFHQLIETAESDMDTVVMPVVETGRTCPRCEKGSLVLKDGRYGPFIACNRYPECDYSEPIVEKAGVPCPLCGSDVIVKTSRKGRRRFYVCDQKGPDKACTFISWDKPVANATCDLCGSYLVEKKMGKTTTVRCSNRECTNGRTVRRRPKNESSHDAS